MKPNRIVNRPGSKQRGSAVVEAVVSMLVFLPLFIVVPLVGKKLTMKEKTMEAGRYALWERTVWGGGGAANDATKSNAQVALEARDRVTGDPDAAIRDPASITAANVSRNPLWVDRRGTTLLATNGGGGGNVTNNAQNAQTHGTGVPEKIGVSGLAANRARSDFNLPDGYVQGGYTQTQRPAIEDWGGFSLSGRKAGANDGQTTGRSDLIQQSATGVLMTNQWLAANEDEYQDTVAEGVLGKEMRYTEVGLSGIGPIKGVNFCQIQKAVGGKGKPVIGEVCYGADSSEADDLFPDSGTLPPRYVDN